MPPRRGHLCVGSRGAGACGNGVGPGRPGDGAIEPEPVPLAAVADPIRTGPEGVHDPPALHHECGAPGECGPRPLRVASLDRLGGLVFPERTVRDPGVPLRRRVDDRRDRGRGRRRSSSGDGPGPHRLLASDLGGECPGRSRARLERRPGSSEAGSRRHSGRVHRKGVGRLVLVGPAMAANRSRALVGIAGSWELGKALTPSGAWSTVCARVGQTNSGTRNTGGSTWRLRSTIRTRSC